jgi:branched-subunit amino acid ABC-type transport system permease component
VYGLLAMAIVLVYRSTRVINFAVGNMGLVGAGLLVVCDVNYGIPFWISLAFALIVGAAYGAIDELVVNRRHFKPPRVIVLVATIGVAQLSLALLSSYPEARGTSVASASRAPSSRCCSSRPRWQLAWAGSSTARSSVAPCARRRATPISPDCPASARS